MTTSMEDPKLDNHNHNDSDLDENRVTLRLDGEAHKVSVSKGETILEAALSAGLYIESSCQIGACGTCKLRRVSGAVARGDHDGLTEEEAKGYVLSCVSRPLGPGLVLTDEA